MNNSDEQKVNDLIHRIGLKNNLRDSEVREIIESQFRFTYETIRSLDLTEKQANGNPRYIFVKGQRDGKYHIYDLCYYKNCWQMMGLFLSVLMIMKYTI